MRWQVPRYYFAFSGFSTDASYIQSFEANGVAEGGRKVEGGWRLGLGKKGWGEVR